MLAARPRSVDDALTHPWLERTRATQASAFVRPYWAGPDATSFDALIAYERENGADLRGSHRCAHECLATRFCGS